MAVHDPRDKRLPGGGHFRWLPALRPGHRIPQVAPDHDRGNDRYEDPELRFDDGRDYSQDRGPFRPIAPQLADAEEQEDHADRVDLTPDHAVEPRDGVEHDEGGSNDGGSPAPSQLERHRPGEIAKGEIGQDRRDLDQVQFRKDLLDDAHEPQRVKVAGRVVVEARTGVETGEPVRGQVVRPASERREIVGEARAGQQVGDDDAEGQPEREDSDDRRYGFPRPGHPRRHVRAPIGLTRRGACQRVRPPERALSRSGV